MDDERKRERVSGWARVSEQTSKFLRKSVQHLAIFKKKERHEAQTF